MEPVILYLTLVFGYGGEVEPIPVAKDVAFCPVLAAHLNVVDAIPEDILEDIPELEQVRRIRNLWDIQEARFECRRG